MRGSDAKAHYADLDVIALPSGGYRLYVESRGAHQIVSFFSLDGTSWARDAGVRISEAAFPDVVLLPEGRVRLYFQQFSQEHRAPVIKSAVSTDGGLTFSPEPGVRVPPGWHGELDPDGVAASSTLLLPDGHYRMYYIGGKRDSEYANGVKAVILSAISVDGLEWTSENGARIAPEDWVDPIPPRPDLGQRKRSYVDGPEAVIAYDGRIKLYFWGICNGICLSVSQDGLNFRQVEQVFANHQLPVVGNAGDPALVKLESDIWLLFYNSVQNGYASIFIARRMPP